MISIYRSNKLRTLCKHLAVRLKETQSEDPFESSTIIVPNQDTAHWLKLALAEELGFAGNYLFQLPGEWQYARIRDLYPDLPKRLPSDPDPLIWSIYDILSNESVLHHFDKLNRFVAAQPATNREDAILQISRKLASLYDQYLIYRPEMILKWQKGNTGNGDEKWQAELWNLLNKKWKSIHTGDLKRNKAELFYDTINYFSTIDSTANQSLHLFNPGLIAEPVVRMLRKTGLQSSLDIYLISPQSHASPTIHPLIDSLGKESEAIETLFDLPGSVIKENFIESPGSNHLQNIQNSIVEPNSDLRIKPQEAKLQGIEIRSCHSTVREIEILHNFLIESFEEDPTLHPDDVLVVTPNIENYQSAIHAVFGKSENGLPDIPYYVSNRNLSVSQLFERAFLHVLSLADSRFTFSGVMDLFMMKPIGERFQVSESEASTIKSWMEENHVFWGLNDSHRTEWNQPGQNLQTWDSALRRGWLGQWMAAEQGEMIHDTLLFSGVKSNSDRKIWAQFSKYLNQVEQVRVEAKQKRSGSDWCELIENWLGSLFNDEILNSDISLNTRRLIDSFKENINLSGLEIPLSYSFIKSEFESKLTEQRSASARFNRGVTFSTMVPVRSIPFKVIALIGLSEGVFPRKVTSPDYDLMTQQPKPTDRNRRNEDRNLFLESILAAENIHYCSFIGQSIQDNESIPPSPIVSDWVDYLSSISGLEPKDLIKEESISSVSPLSFKKGSNYSSLSATSVSNMVNGFKTQGLKNQAPLPEPEESKTISTADLISFYANPIRSLTRSRFDAYLHDREEEKEEFAISHLDRHILFQKVFGWILKGESIVKIKPIILNSGLLPSGWPGDYQVNEIIEKVESAIKWIKDHGFNPGMYQIPISLSVDEFQIDGEILSYSSEQLLDVSFSNLSGKNRLACWIKHLLIQAADSNHLSESFLISDLKKGDPSVLRFKKVEDPENHLKQLIRVYYKGQAYPELFFPNTLFAFEEQMDKDASKAIQKAKLEFEGDSFGRSFPENSDLNIKFILGDDVEFGEELIKDEYRAVIQAMQNHMEGLE